MRAGARPEGGSFVNKKHVPPTAQDSLPPIVAEGSAAPVEEPLYKELLWSKRFWLGVVLLGLFLYFTTAVPVAKIPFLRTLVEAMGYSEPETHKISFFKALLTWNEHSKTLKAEAADELQARYSAAKAVTGALESAQQNRGGLLDFKELNRSLKAQGKEAEVLQRTGLAEQSKEALLVQMSGQETRIDTQMPTANTRGSVSAPQIGEADVPAEVFFGEEEGKNVRDVNSGFDSTKQLAAVKSPGVIDSTPADWKLQEADSFWARHKGVVFNNKLFNVGEVSNIKGQNVLTVVDVKPRADMVYAWMTSRAGRRTQNIALKQTFSKAGFMGADLSRPMLVSSFDGTGVLPIDSEKMRTDFNVAEDRIQLEKECNEALNATQDDILNDMKSAGAKRDELPGQLDNCKTVMDGYSAFRNTLNEIAGICESVKEKYRNMKGKCRMEIILGKCGDKNPNIINVAEGVKGDCQTKFEEYQREYVTDANGNPQRKYTDEQCYIKATLDVLTEQRKEEIKEKINKEMDLNPSSHEDSSNSYFSQVDWMGTLRNRQYNEQL